MDKKNSESTKTFKVGKTKVSPNLKASIIRALDKIGGISEFIQPGDDIILKPNLNTADPYPASSDPEFIRALCEIILDEGVKRLRIMESSMFALDSNKIAEDVGLDEVARNLDIDLVIFDNYEWVKQDIPKGKFFKRAQFAKPLLDDSKLVIVPCLKTHKHAGLTGAMKLFVGAVRGRSRLFMHMRNLEEKVVDLASFFQPALIVMDARKIFVTGGPAHGQLEEPNVILTGTDMVSIDVEGIRIIQSYGAENDLKGNPWKTRQIAHAVELGLGASSDDDILLIEDQISSIE